jgi:hypothetical protein
MTTNRDINTIPTTDRHIVSYKIQVEWSDNPKSVLLEHDMPSHVANAIDEWFGEIETEENVK